MPSAALDLAAPAVQGGAGAANFNAANSAQFTDGFFGTYGFPMMMASGAIASAGDIFAGQAQAQALQTQASFTENQAAETVKRAAMATEESGKEEQTELQQSGSHAEQIIGAERAAYGSQGVNVNAGVPLAEQVAQGKMSAVDALTIRNNASLRAFGINAGAQEQASEQEFQAMGETNEANQSLALGGAKAANAITSGMDQYLYTRAFLSRSV
jgi:hypothetical protein